MTQEFLPNKFFLLIFCLLVLVFDFSASWNKENMVKVAKISSECESTEKKRLTSLLLYYFEKYSGPKLILLIIK